MSKWLWILIFFVLTPPLFADNTAYVLEINNTIGPATQDYIQRGLKTAENDHAQLVIIQMDTPGGLETAMLGINKAILASPIPVVTYVAPSGARAASAGTFILYASHIAAMAPGTHLGAASPVRMGDSTDNTVTKKEMNDAAAYIRSLAELRQRNVQWGELAVREATSLPAHDALKQNVINLIAENTENLLHKLNDKPVQTQNGIHTLQTKNITIKTIHPNWRTEFLSIITNPSVAYILLLIGIYGLFFEFATPGMILPGIVGVICLLLAFYAFQLLPISYVGLTLLLVGIVFMVAEVFITSFGILGIGGIIAFIVGSIMLFDTNVPGFGIAWPLIVSMGVITFGFFFLVLMLAFRSARKPIVSGREALIGSVGEVLEYYPDYVIVSIHGEIWNAQCEEKLTIGQKVRVAKISNLVLTIKPI